MSLSIRLFSHTNVTIYFFFFNHVHLAQVKVHQSKGIQQRSFLLWDAPGRRVTRSYDSKVTLQSNFPGHKYLLTMWPPAPTLPGRKHLHSFRSTQSQILALRQFHKWNHVRRKDMSNYFGGGMEGKIACVFNTDVKNVVLNKVASL